jgi:anti-anti-sigma factor
MTTIPGGKPPAPHQRMQPVSPQPDTAGAAVPPRRSRPAVITLPGEIDITNDGRVRDTLSRALDGGTAVLIADASRTTYCACAGVHALLLTHHQAAATAAQLRVAASPAMRRMLKLTGADHMLDTYPTLAAALAGRSRSPAQPPPEAM